MHKYTYEKQHKRTHAFWVESKLRFNNRKQELNLEFLSCYFKEPKLGFHHQEEHSRDLQVDEYGFIRNIWTVISTNKTTYFLYSQVRNFKK